MATGAAGIEVCTQPEVDANYQPDFTRRHTLNKRLHLFRAIYRQIKDTR
jgi:hypothetical protein